MVREKRDTFQGTLDMLVLKALQLEPMHGWGITERIEQWSEQVFQLGQGTLYPALYRLERQGLIKSEWKVTKTIAALATTRSPGKAGATLPTSWRSGGGCRGPST